MKYLFLFCLGAILSLTAAAQTWPTHDCLDRPYTKGNSDSIFHTGKCDLAELTSGISGTSSSTNSFVLATNCCKVTNRPGTQTAAWYSNEPDNRIPYLGCYKCSFDSSSNNKIVKRHMDSLLCPMCHKILPWRHVMYRAEFGYIVKDGKYNIITPLGLNEIEQRNKYGTANGVPIPRELWKYLPPGYSEPGVFQQWKARLHDTEYGSPE